MRDVGQAAVMLVILGAIDVSAPMKANFALSGRIVLRMAVAYMVAGVPAKSVEAQKSHSAWPRTYCASLNAGRSPYIGPLMWSACRQG